MSRINDETSFVCRGDDFVISLAFVTDGRYLFEIFFFSSLKSHSWSLARFLQPLKPCWQLKIIRDNRRFGLSIAVLFWQSPSLAGMAWEKSCFLPQNLACLQVADFFPTWPSALRAAWKYLAQFCETESSCALVLEPLRFSYLASWSDFFKKYSSFLELYHMISCLQHLWRCSTMRGLSFLRYNTKHGFRCVHWV